jgi:hypothetical protein
MKFPLNYVFKRGAVFFDPLYSKLDDPTLKDQTKGKFFVVLNTSPKDDPIVYLLTTSEKAKHAGKKYMYGIQGGSYDCFPQNTLIDVANAGDEEIASEEFAALYDEERIQHKGQLSDSDVAGLLALIQGCPTVTLRFKKTLIPPSE